MSTPDFRTLERKEVEVPIDGKDYVLCEAKQSAVAAWRNFQTEKAKFSQDGSMVAVGAIADGNPLLVSKCLFEVREGKRVSVPFSTVADWPPRVVDWLFEKVKEISGLNPKKTVEALDEEILALQRLREELSLPNS